MATYLIRALFFWGFSMQNWGGGGGKKRVLLTLPEFFGPGAKRKTKEEKKNVLFWTRKDLGETTDYSKKRKKDNFHMENRKLNRLQPRYFRFPLRHRDG